MRVSHNHLCIFRSLLTVTSFTAWRLLGRRPSQARPHRRSRCPDRTRLVIIHLPNALRARPVSTHKKLELRQCLAPIAPKPTVQLHLCSQATKASRLKIYTTTIKTLCVETRMADPAEHIGTLHKDRLERAIYDCLTWSCPLHDANRGMKPCTPKNSWSPCKVETLCITPNYTRAIRMVQMLGLRSLSSKHGTTRSIWERPKQW